MGFGPNWEQAQAQFPQMAQDQQSPMSPWMRMGRPEQMPGIAGAMPGAGEVEQKAQSFPGGIPGLMAGAIAPPGTPLGTPMAASMGGMAGKLGGAFKNVKLPFGR